MNNEKALSYLSYFEKRDKRKMKKGKMNLADFK